MLHVDTRIAVNIRNRLDRNNRQVHIRSSLNARAGIYERPLHRHALRPADERAGALHARRRWRHAALLFPPPGRKAARARPRAQRCESPETRHTLFSSLPTFLIARELYILAPTSLSRFISSSLVPPFSQTIQHTHTAFCEYSFILADAA